MAASYGGLIRRIWSLVNHFDYERYWKMREYICAGGGGVRAYYYLFRIKRMDSYHCASFGTHISFPSAHFEDRPILPHGLNGIIIANDVHIGKHCTIYHQVSIAGGNGGSPTVGDNVFIGAGAKIIGPVHIGNNVRIGAGCVVSIDVPDNSTVVMSHPRIIIRKVPEQSYTRTSEQSS